MAPLTMAERTTAVRTVRTVLYLQAAVVPLHERLGHFGEGGANVRLVCGDPRGGGGGGGARDVLLVATRAIAAGEALTRDYSEVPVTVL